MQERGLFVDCLCSILDQDLKADMAGTLLNSDSFTGQAASHSCSNSCTLVVRCSTVPKC